MLVLKRKVGESVVLDEQIEVQVLSVEGETVKLGFSAPAQIQIMRKELMESILQENQDAGRQKFDQKRLLNLLKQFKE
jgi:carbon storage regulator (csrA)